MDASIDKIHFTVTRKPIGDHCQPAVPFHITGTLEELIEDGINNWF